MLSQAPAFAQAATPTQTDALVQAKAASPAQAHAPAPAAVARKLFRAWLRGDRAAAAKVASPAAVSSLFAYVYRAPDRFDGCTGNACRFTHTSVRVPGGLNGILMVVSGPKVTRVYTSSHLTKPSLAATSLFKAWTLNDRSRALQFAAVPAVKTLFRTEYDPKGVTHTFQGCSAEPKGHACAYSYEGGAMLMHVRGSKHAGYDVRSITYIAD